MQLYSVNSNITISKTRWRFSAPLHDYPSSGSLSQTNMAPFDIVQYYLCRAMAVLQRHRLAWHSNYNVF